MEGHGVQLNFEQIFHNERSDCKDCGVHCLISHVLKQSEDGYWGGSIPNPSFCHTLIQQPELGSNETNWHSPKTQQLPKQVQFSKKGSFQKYFKVYQREGQRCKRLKCDGNVKKKNISNRSTFFCNICQK